MGINVNFFRGNPNYIPEKTPLSIRARNTLPTRMWLCPTRQVSVALTGLTTSCKLWFDLSNTRACRH
jgi:hypothetical protein